MIALRTLVVLSAVAFVGAVALATLFSPLTSLAELVARDDLRVLTALNDWIVAHSSVWVWDTLVVPVMQRPCWLLPVSIGVVSAGGAATLASRPGVPRSHRRRS